MSTASLLLYIQSKCISQGAENVKEVVYILIVFFNEGNGVISKAVCNLLPVSSIDTPLIRPKLVASFIMLSTLAASK